MIKLTKNDMQVLHSAYDKVKDDILFLTYLFQSNDTQISEEQLGKVKKDAGILAEILDYIEWRVKNAC